MKMGPIFRNPKLCFQLLAIGQFVINVAVCPEEDLINTPIETCWSFSVPE